MTKNNDRRTSELALYDQTRALIADATMAIRNHWPSCKMAQHECIGSRANQLIVDFASQSGEHTKALLFLAIIDAATARARVAELEKENASYREAIRLSSAGDIAWVSNDAGGIVRGIKE